MEKLPQKYFISKSSSLKCHFCKEIPLSAFRIRCDSTSVHPIFCKECISNWIAQNGNCPLDKKSLTLNEIFQDDFITKMIQDSKIMCLNKEKGCKWKGKVMQLQSHLEKCETSNSKEEQLEPPYVLFIRNLNRNVSEDVLRGFFDKSKILDIRMKPQFTLIHVASVEDLKEGLKKNGQTIPGTDRKITVCVAKLLLLPKAHKKIKKTLSDNVSIVWIGNIAEMVTEIDISNALSKFSETIITVKIEPIKPGGSETYGCIYVSSAEDANKIGKPLILKIVPRKRTQQSNQGKNQGYGRGKRENYRGGGRGRGNRGGSIRPIIFQAPQRMFSQHLEMLIDSQFKPYVYQMEKKYELGNKYQVTIVGLDNFHDDKVVIIGSSQNVAITQQKLTEIAKELRLLDIKVFNDRHAAYVKSIAKKYECLSKDLKKKIIVTGFKKSIDNVNSKLGNAICIQINEPQSLLIKEVLIRDLKNLVKECDDTKFFINENNEMLIIGKDSNQLYNMISSLIHVIRYNEIEFEYEENAKKYIQKQLKILKQTLPSQTSTILMDEKLNNGNGSVTLISKNTSSFAKAIEHIKSITTVENERIPLSGNIKLKELQKHFQNIEQDEDVSIEIERNNSGKESKRELVIFGKKENVKAAVERIQQVLEGSTVSTFWYPMQRFIYFFFVRDIQDILGELKEKSGVDFLGYKQLDKRGIKICGKKPNVKEAIHMLDVFMERYYKMISFESINGFTPGMIQKLYEEKSLLNEIRNTLGVDIKLPLPSDSTTLKLQISKTHSYTIQVRHGNITECSNADIIVNSANSEMKHNGGVAAAISTASGNSFERACISYVKFMGPLKEGEVLITPSFNIYFATYIMNVVCPVYKQGAESFLEAVCQTILKGAEKLCAECIAIPVLGAGIYGFPTQIASDILVRVCIKFLEQSPKNLKTIILVDNEEPKVKQLIKSVTNEARKSGLWKGVPQEPSNGPADIWYWFDDDNQWKAFKKCYNIELNHACNSGKNPVKLVIEDKEYIFDFTNLKQINVKTGYTRQIQKNVVMKQKVIQWCWQDDKNTFTPYNVETSRLIEQYFRNDPTRLYTFTFKRHVDDIPKQYIIDLKNMVQINKETNYKRKIHREVIETTVIPENNDDNELDIYDDLPPRIRLFGMDDAQVKKAKEKILERKKFLTKQVVLTNCSLEPQTLKEIAAKWKVDIISSKPNAWIIVGDETPVLYAQSEIAKAEKEIFPKSWTWKTTEKLELITISQNSEEWNFVLSKMKETLPNVKIKKIERVQHKDLWEWYFKNLLQIKDKNGNKDIEYEKWLFHGTRTTDPSHIYKKGFDMRYCNGMWGQGVYFAVNASYSNNGYFYQSPEGRQLFLAKVIVGDYVSSPPNSSLRFPPYKDQQAMIMYDSVKGNTCGSDVFIVYSNQQAYPYYLITYDDK